MSRQNPASCINLGRHSYTGYECNCPFAVKVNVGSYTSISAHVTFMGDASQHASVWDNKLASTFPFREKCGVTDFPTGIPDYMAPPITIGSDCWIGYGVSIVRSIAIGHGAIIGARAVVAGDIAPYAIAVGNPARVVKYRYTHEMIEDLLRIQWWTWDHDKIIKHIHLIKNVEELIAQWKKGTV